MDLQRASHGYRRFGKSEYYPFRKICNRKIISLPTSLRPTQDESGGTPDDTEYLRIDAPQGKKIAVAVRIEPKVIFACERTFLVRCEILEAPALLSSDLFSFRNGWKYRC